MANSALDNFFVNTYGPTGLGILAHYYPCSEASGFILDGVGSLNGTAGAGITYGQASILPTTDGKTCLQATNATIGNVAFLSNFGGYPKTFEIAFKPTSVSTSITCGLFQNGGVNDGAAVQILYGFTPAWIGLFNNAGGQVAHATFTFVVGTFYHIVLTTDGTVAGTKVYINGTLQSMSGASAASVPTSPQAAILGSLTSTAGATGFGEKACIYNAVLTQTQVTNNFNALSTGPPASGGPVAPPMGGNLAGYVSGGFAG